jgi:Ulp1 family protease
MTCEQESSQSLIYHVYSPFLCSILVYPSSGPGQLNITSKDLGRLRPGEFLNDVLIELGLKYFFFPQIIMCPGKLIFEIGSGSIHYGTTIPL